MVSTFLEGTHFTLFFFQVYFWWLLMTLEIHLIIIMIDNKKIRLEDKEQLFLDYFNNQKQIQNMKMFGKGIMCGFGITVLLSFGIKNRFLVL